MGAVGYSGVNLDSMCTSYQQYLDSQRFLGLDPQQADTSAATTAPTAATCPPTAVPPATATPSPTAPSALPTYAPTPLAMAPTATAYLAAQPQPTARPASHREQPKVTVSVSHGIIRHGKSVMVRVRTRPGANALITLRLTRQGTRCTGAARHRVCARVTVVLAQRVVRVRANRQGLAIRSVTLSYSPASAVRAMLGVRVTTPYGAVTHAAAVLLRPASRSR
jgi:hypothetical protein